MSEQLPLGFEEAAAPAVPPPDPLLARDEQARASAVDPRTNVALEASAGTGKTRVLVDRYVNLLLAGVDPRQILAITFTRKAAAEMRQRVVLELTRRAQQGAIPEPLWADLRDRLGEIAISTIDAFCMSLLREFPLEADVDPGFDVADETETPRLIGEALDRALRIGRARAVQDEEVGLVFARLGEARLRRGLAHLLDRRMVAGPALDRFLARGPRGLTAAAAAAQGASRLRRVLELGEGGLRGFLQSGPMTRRFQLLARGLRRLDAADAPPGAAPEVAAELPVLLERLQDHFFTRSGTPRKRVAATKAQFPDDRAYKQHQRIVQAIAPEVGAAIAAYRTDLNGVLAGGVRWIFRRALDEYRRTLEDHAVIDFTDALAKALDLLRQMDEFSRSRYRLEARYQHVLVDEFQDTSRAQWELVALLIQAWGEGLGLAADGRLPPSIFIVGDRKQSIYGFRDAEVAVLDEAARFIQALRPQGTPRQSIARSFRSLPALLAFVNDVCEDLGKAAGRRDAFRYDDADRFPVPEAAVRDARSDVVAIAAGPDQATCARAVAAEIARMLADGDVVRDRQTGEARAARPGDVAVLFRSRDSHREYERELERRGVPFYVYKGLGFFDAEEVKDTVALIDYLAAPDSDLRAAAFLRSRLVRVSDEALKVLAPGLAAALVAAGEPAAASQLGDADQARLQLARASMARWRPLVDRVPPAELVDLVLHESAYAYTLRGRGLGQARENLKKVRALVRRIQNRGYATMGRVSERLARLMAGDESNAMIDAADAVNLMTVHAAKGLEFPVVFLVNLAKGAGGRDEPVTVLTAPAPFDQEPDDAVTIDGLGEDLRAERDARELEESKRLLYVAITRARDRVCLVSPLDAQGRFRAAPASLGAVLPPSLQQLFEQAGAATAPASLPWHGPRGVHRVRVLAAGAEPEAVPVTAPESPRPEDFAQVALTWRVPRTATAAADDEGALRGDPEIPLVLDAPGIASSTADGADGAPPAELGTLVHQALAAGLLRLAPGPARRARIERVAGAAAPHVDAALEALAASPAIRRLLDGDWWHEVPFTWRDPEGSLVRGAIDVLVVEDASVTVLEVKTGAPEPGHLSQAETYVVAARDLFPGRAVTGQLIYLTATDVRFVLVSA